MSMDIIENSLDGRGLKSALFNLDSMNMPARVC